MRYSHFVPNVYISKRLRKTVFLQHLLTNLSKHCANVDKNRKFIPMISADSEWSTSDNPRELRVYRE